MHRIRVYVKSVGDVKSDACGQILPVTRANKLSTASVCISQSQVGKHTHRQARRQADGVRQCFSANKSWADRQQLSSCCHKSITRLIGKKVLNKDAMYRQYILPRHRWDLFRHDTSQGNYWSRNKYVGYSLKAVLFRSNPISRLHWRVCKQAAFQGWVSICWRGWEGGQRV